MSWFIVNVPIDEVDRAQLDGVIEGFCRVLVARGTENIVGADGNDVVWLVFSNCWIT